MSKLRFETLFNSFYIGGFECADHINRYGQRVNLLKETAHDTRAQEDYNLLKQVGINVVREGICWSEVEKTKGKYDFSEVLNRMRIAEKTGIQQIWDLVHFGYPDDLYPTHPQFCLRFENLCLEFATFHKKNSSNRLMVIPINEISFISWLSGDVRGAPPFLTNSGWDTKYHLCKAAIGGIKILKNELPDCIIISSEPLIRIHGNELTACELLHEINQYQYQATDIITGKICPELQGDKSLIDILGVNYYWTCQWVIDSSTLPWPGITGKRVPLHSLLDEIYCRYQIPLLITETGHFGIGRVPWLFEINKEISISRRNNIPVLGICIYPVTDRPDWDNLQSYSNCGIYDLDENKNRIPDQNYVKYLYHYTQIIMTDTYKVNYSD